MTDDETELRLKLRELDHAVNENVGQIALLNAAESRLAATAEQINLAKHEASLQRQLIERERAELHAALAKLAP